MATRTIPPGLSAVLHTKRTMKQLAALGGFLLAWHPAAQAFDFNDVVQRAEQLAASPYKKSESNLPKELVDLNYDKFRDIRYKPEKSWWRDANLPFELTFFHQGWHYNQPVRINEVTKQGVSEIKLDPCVTPR